MASPRISFALTEEEYLAFIQLAAEQNRTHAGMAAWIVTRALEARAGKSNIKPVEGTVKHRPAYRPPANSFEERCEQDQERIEASTCSEVFDLEAHKRTVYP